MSSSVSSIRTRSRRKRACRDGELGDGREAFPPVPAPTELEEIMRNGADRLTRQHKRRPRYTMCEMTDYQSHSQPPQPSLVSRHEQQPTSVDLEIFQAEGSGATTINLPRRCSADPIPCTPHQLQSTQIHLSPSQEQIADTDLLPSQAGGSGVDSGFDSDSTKRRTRGPTRCLSVWWRPEGMRKISIPTNRHGHPIGPKACRLGNFLGTLARDGNRAPLTYVHWREMPVANKEDMWELVQSKFNIDPSAKSWVMKSLGTKWRNWKCILKTNHYYKWDTDEERLQDRDDRVLEEQWRALIKFWGSEKEKVRSMTNSRNRARLKFLHTTGTKSFARIREEERVKRPDGEEPDQTDMFIITRKRRDGGTLNKATAEVISKLESETSKQPNPLQKSTTREEIFSQVMGEDRRGRVRTYGLGDLWGQTPSKAEALKLASEAKMANEELCKMREAMEAMMQKYAALETEHAAMKNQMASFFTTLMKQPPGAMDCQVVNNSNEIPSSADRATPSLKGTSTSNVIGSSDQRYQKKKGRINHGKNRCNS